MFKILIADDEELSRSVIRCILEYYFKGKFLLFEASNGREAVCLALGERIDVAFLDIEMPVMDGLTAGWEIKQQLPDSEVSERLQPAARKPVPFPFQRRYPVHG